MEKLISGKQVAEILGVPPSNSILKVIPQIRIGKHVRYHPCDLDAYLAHMRGDSSPLIWNLLQSWVQKHKNDLPEDVKAACFLVLEIISK